MTSPYSSGGFDAYRPVSENQSTDLAPLRIDCRLPRLLIHSVQTYVEVRVQRLARVPEEPIEEISITLITAAAKEGSAERSITLDEGTTSIVRLFFEPSRVGRFLADLRVIVSSGRGNMRAEGEWSRELQIEPYPDSVKSLSINMSGGVFAPFAEQMQFMKDADINTVVSREFADAPWEPLKLKWSWASPSAPAKPGSRAASALWPAFSLVMLTLWAAIIASGCWLAANAWLPRNEAGPQTDSVGKIAAAKASVLPEAKSLDDAQIGQIYTVRLPGGAEMPLCYCPPTNYRTEPFLMGSPQSEEWHDKNEQQIEVRITHGFWMAQTECTQSQWCAITDALHDAVDINRDFRGSEVDWDEFKKEYSRRRDAIKYDSYFREVATQWITSTTIAALSGKSEEHNPSYPIANVSWNEVHDTFLRKLKERVPLPNGWTWALPTEAEWEWACRAGSSGLWGIREDGKMGSLEEMGWYLTSKHHEVKTKGANAWGLHDMHGGVWEWCNDSWSGETVLAGGENPTSQFGEKKVVRGGGFLSVASECRAAKRGHREVAGKSSDSDSSSSPKTMTYPTFNDVGFRLVVVPSNEAAVREKPGNKVN